MPRTKCAKSMNKILFKKKSHLKLDDLMSTNALKRSNYLNIKELLSIVQLNPDFVQYTYIRQGYKLGIKKGCGSGWSLHGYGSDPQNKTRSNLINLSLTLFLY